MIQGLEFNKTQNRYLDLTVLNTLQYMDLVSEKRPASGMYWIEKKLIKSQPYTPTNRISP